RPGDPLAAGPALGAGAAGRRVPALARAPRPAAGPGRAGLRRRLLPVRRAGLARAGGPRRRPALAGPRPGHRRGGDRRRRAGHGAAARRRPAAARRPAAHRRRRRRGGGDGGRAGVAGAPVRGRAVLLLGMAAAAAVAACSPLPATPRQLGPGGVFEAAQPAVVIVETDNEVTWSVPQPALTGAKEQQLRDRVVAMVRAGQVANTEAGIGLAEVRLLVQSPDSWFT